VESHISRTTSEMWGTADSGSKCNKIGFACSAHKRNAWSEIGGDALSWSMEDLESKGRFPLCPQTRLLLPPNLLKTLTKSRFRDLLHLEFVPAHPRARWQLEYFPRTQECA
jgi:hypothetical protein